MATSHVAFNTSFKGKQTNRPLLERGSSCYRSSCHPLLNCGNHGNESSHSCWWYSPVTLAKSPMSTSKTFIIAPRKTRENHENEQGVILLTFRVCSMHLLQEGKYTTDFISSPLICILQRQTPQTQRPGLSDLARVYQQLQLQHSAPPLTLHCPRPASMFTTMREKWFPKQKNSKSKFCFYAAWPWTGTVAEEVGSCHSLATGPFNPLGAQRLDSQDNVIRSYPTFHEEPSCQMGPSLAARRHYTALHVITF